MTCSEVNTYFDQVARRGWAALPEPVRKHLGICLHCRSLWEFLTQGEPPADVSPKVQSRIESNLLGSLKPVSPLPSNRMLTLAFLLIFGLISALFVAFSSFRGIVGLESLQLFGILGVVGAVAFLLTLALSREMVPGERRSVSSV